MGLFNNYHSEWTEEKAINELNQRSSRRARKQGNFLVYDSDHRKVKALFNKYLFSQLC